MRLLRRLPPSSESALRVRSRIFDVLRFGTPMWRRERKQEISKIQMRGRHLLGRHARTLRK